MAKKQSAEPKITPHNEQLEANKAKRAAGLVYLIDPLGPNPAIVREEKKRRVGVLREVYIEAMEALLAISKEDFQWEVEAVKGELSRLQLKMLNGEE